jgi:ABC-2 type transport system ATP-binding protein
VIVVENLTKDYGTVVALRDASFRVGQGEVVGFLGPNGAGKTTTLRILAGFLGATSGSVRINGLDIFTQSLEVRRSMGYMPEGAPLYPEMRVREYLGFRAAIKRVPRRARTEAVARAMARASVTDVADTLIQHLSKGYRQRVGLADALVSSPPLLILDEPTAGLDPNQIRQVRALIRELGKNHTIFLSTHILSEVESVCDRAIVVHKGRVVADGSLAELSRGSAPRGATLVVRDPEARAASVLEGLSATVTIESVQEGLSQIGLVPTSEPANAGGLLERAVALLVGSNIAVREARPLAGSLEDAFADLTRDAVPADAPEGEAP